MHALYRINKRSLWSCGCSERIRLKMIVKIRAQRARLWVTPEGWWRWELLPAVHRFQVSGVSNSSRPAGWQSLMNWTFYHRWWPSASTQSGFRTQDSFYTDTWNLTPETTYSLDRWHSRLSLTWPKGQGFLQQNKMMIEIYEKYSTWSTWKYW